MVLVSWCEEIWLNRIEGDNKRIDEDSVAENKEQQSGDYLNFEKKMIIFEFGEHLLSHHLHEFGSFNFLLRNWFAFGAILINTSVSSCVEK